MTREQKKAYLAGAEAFAQERGALSNPYTCALALYWDMGYNDALDRSF